MSHSVCVISSRAPYCGQVAREALDTALVSASYDIETSLLLIGDGVYQLLKGQDAGQIPRKSLLAMLQVLPLYGIETIHVDQVSLDERGINSEALQEGVTVLAEGELPQFIQQHSRVFNF
ncbi:sulfurtransferase complex subunit TusC [Endozoicomonas sp. SCSIO W0465]|uniref:sulfurtransferase complex subunit TusC n=1 Tax=Endozoicomonas sp. SCSIO W0465 TaxID=2918516 RepID=UPI002074D85C|nr:sulfurtransferase complex subunit TusC [Endozoicomonas sp. SCSIO W0465]USE39182.1 sulfurtransferase complex subunit TusC [Endozoicomonas sp. SCSIO W0465]